MIINWENDLYIDPWGVFQGEFVKSYLSAESLIFELVNGRSTITQNITDESTITTSISKRSVITQEVTGESSFS